MKYDEQMLNNADIGDRVYGCDNESDLIKAIEEIKDAMCNLLTRALDSLV